MLYTASLWPRVLKLVDLRETQLAIYYIFCYIFVTMAENKERTFIMIKPDGVQRGLVGKIVQRFEDKGFKLVAMKMVWVS